ncbi:alpha-2,8-sialyltransferase 8E isoform X2 [Mustelus asterias]
MYSDPSGRDLLGNRTLFFIFICSFAIVTLLQQILYGKNYIKSGLHYKRQNTEDLDNVTGAFNFMDDGGQKTDSDLDSRYFELREGPFKYNSSTCWKLRNEIMEVKILSMVKQSELFDRWKTLQLCKWEMNNTAANIFKSHLMRCCNAPVFLFTTQKNTPKGFKLKYEVDSSGFLFIDAEVFQLFPKEMPYSRSQFKKCAVIGNGGILTNSRCGNEIDSADFVFRFQKLEKWRRPFYEVLQAYENASVVMPAFYNTRNTDVSFRVKYVLDDFESQQSMFYFHPRYLENVSRFWMRQGLRAKRLSSGLMLVTAAMELCEEVHLYGFWAFSMDPSGLYITHHYYDNVKPRPGFHKMTTEIFNFLHMHSKGILQVHTGTCS